ncbi:MAG: flagellar FliJ family protein [Gemmatimonadaceae bacterium]|nr:flagellar FliJ family protein [Gemmatimonadaceae bacterium]
MSQFRFSLARLLALRQRVKRDAAAQAAQARALLTEAEEARDAVAQECDAARSMMQPALDSQAQVSTLRQASVLRDSLMRHLELSQAAVAAQSDELQRRIARLQACSSASRVLERLEDKRREAWQVEAARSDQAVTDDAAQARFLRDVEE